VGGDFCEKWLPWRNDLGVACELVCIVFDQLGVFWKIGFDQLDS
jgi:hypothetical protein